MIRSFSIPRPIADRMHLFVRDTDANVSAIVSDLLDAELRRRGY